MKKVVSLLVAVVLTFTLFTTTAFAANEKAPILSQNTSDIIITPYADVIVKYYRMYDGLVQYRRWNETRGYWVDPYWIYL